MNKPFGTLVVSLFACFTVHTHADGVSDLRSLSVFRDADLNRLGAGDVLAGRGPTMSFNRGLAVETAYVVRAPVPRTVGLHQQWDPSRHPELKVFLQGQVPARPSPANFERLAAAPANGSVNAFANATLSIAADPAKLQVSAAEAKLPQGAGETGKGLNGGVVQFWSRVLAQRAQAFASGGIAAVPAFEGSNGPVRPGEDAQRLLAENGKVRQQFGPVLERSGRGGTTWRLFDVDGQAAVSLSAFSSVSLNDGALAEDATYYSSGGFYVLLTFLRFWPVTINNEPATLVWRVDMISSPAFSELRGIERVGSGAAFMREIQRSVKAFLRDSGTGR
jgi:hypothetical protein